MTAAATSTPPRTRVRRSGRDLLVSSAERYALVVIFVVLLVAFSAHSDKFLSASNVRIVLGSQAPLGIFALASLIPLAIGQFDLSVVAIGGTSSIALATTMSRFHQSLGVAIVVAVVVGGLLGLVNGIMVARVKVSSFVVTLAMSTVLQGVVQGYTGGKTIGAGISQHLLNGSVGQLWDIPRGLFWLVPAALVVWYVLEQTPLGRHVRVIGSNPSAGRLMGLRVDGLVTGSFVASGAVAALGGILLVGQSGDADPQTALGSLLLPALAAVFLGASAFRPGSFNVAGTVLAIYLVAFTVSGLSFLGAQPWVEPVLDGAVLAVAVTISTYLRRARRPS